LTEKNLNIPSKFYVYVEYLINAGSKEQVFPPRRLKIGANPSCHFRKKKKNAKTA